MDLLPDELLADILGRLPPCSLAASRCVRKDWCAIIDARRLLRADLLPLRLDGFFCLIDPYWNPEAIGVEHYHTVFFARPSTGRRINGDLDSLWDDDHDPHNPWVSDHCNGLVLLFPRVIFNPATGQSVRLPPFPRLGMGEFYKHRLIAYDPITSPQHYEVLFFPYISDTQEDNKDSEWPPSSLTTQVFSSRKWRWEERSFVREGEAAGTIADMNTMNGSINRTVYLRGVLYVPCPNNSIMRITLWNNRYQVVKVPKQVLLQQGYAYLGKSQKGVYCALLYGWSQFRVWLLDECGEMEWALKCGINLEMVGTSPINDHAAGYNTRWIVNYEKDVSEAQTEDESEWDFESVSANGDTRTSHEKRSCS
ncbi:hypothetical protein EJB05_39692 [Eragrostis curvula]|uniref:F-box domain-containing protein n=1 Tax=Eragrostis curvula TaxID=38414 RepID=A0A5J9TZJ7_9POAL|nr:hypothetical protein EJB05_39692 [Eragrostis curvula]